VYIEENLSYTRQLPERYSIGSCAGREKPVVKGAGEVMSTREMEVLKLTNGSLSNQEIADELYLSLRTVQTHFVRGNSRTGAVVHALKAGRVILEARDFKVVGQMIASLHLPSLVVQEGGYDTRVLGINARNYLTGLWAGSYSSEDIFRT